MSKTEVQIQAIRLGVGVFVEDAQRRVLLERRKDCGLWCMPGGMVEVGETVESAALREVFEETGFRVEISDVIGVYSHSPAERLITYPDTGTFQLIDIALRGKIISGNLKCSAESLDVRFCDRENLPEILPRAKQPILDGLQGVRAKLR